ncbi:MAG: F0F1 ATP synthase subunit delta [Candidatus Riesia sp.]|nr:F0F1 ATP synthase subunit delta [Candidatus Riesia sp.]
MSEITIARPYAKAIFNIAKKNNKFDEWDNVLSYLSFIISDENVVDFIKNKTIGHETKSQVISSIFFMKDSIDDSVKDLCSNFIKVLAYHSRLLYANEIKELYVKHVNFHLGKVEATVEVSAQINNEEKEEIVLCLSKKLDKKVSALFNVNENLLGGFLIRIDDSVLDASIAGNLISLRNKIMM